MKNNKTKSAIVLVIFVAIVALCGYLVVGGFGKEHKGKAEHIKLGLDLAGGVSITYEIQDENPSEKDITDTIYKITKRVEKYSTESNVYKSGANRITVEIPGVTDANEILTALGKPGSLSFVDESGTELLTGSDVQTADATQDTSSTVGTKQYVVQLEMTAKGAEKFQEATKNNIGKQIAIIYDGEVISAPNVENEIEGGSAVINGMETFEEADQLATSIRIGSLPLELKELRSNVVAAQLGAEAVKSSLMAGAIGLGIVCLFMICVYLFPGFVASIALLAYVLLTLLALNGFNVTLTLPGMAGIILSIGMAVDANVIIFTRIKEEIALGKSVKTAIDSGFHKAMSAILDGNITTLIAAAVLYLKGTGTIKGFATTLAIGIVLSMFTALVITKLLIQSFYTFGVQNPKAYGKAKARKVRDYVKVSKICFVISLVVIIAGLVFLPINKKNNGSAMNFSLEFVGGTSMTLTLDKDMTTKEAEKEIVPVVVKAADISKAGVQVQAVQDAEQVVIKTSELSVTQREAVQKALEEAFTVKAFESENISGTISNEMRKDAVISIIIATIFMLIYIAFRFKDIKFGTSAVIALLHDVLVVFAVYSIARFSVGNTFIACMLTIIGYSINATIIIFDRIRENTRTLSVSRDGYKLIVNTSISQTFTRTLNTSFTTFIMVFVLCLLGATSIKEFSIALMAGIVCGAYSSVCITGPLWYLMRTTGKNNAKYKEIDVAKDEAILAGKIIATTEGITSTEEPKAKAKSENATNTTKKINTSKKKNNKKKK